MLDILTVGDSTIDTILVIDEASLSCDLQQEHCQLCFNYADKIPIQQSEQSVGGNAANVSVGMAKLGFNTAIVTELGEDIHGNTIKQELKKLGVKTNFVKMTKNGETNYGIILTYKGERTILSYHAPKKYLFPSLPESHWVYFTSLGQSFEKLQTKLEAHLKKYPQIRLAINPGSYQIRHGLESIKKLFPRTDILFVNRAEANLILNKEEEIKKTMAELHQLGAKVVVITDGNNGSYASDGQNNYHLPTYPVKLVSKTGAGDAYTSGFLAAVTSKKSLLEAMQWGTANSCSVIQKFGAQGNLLNLAGIKRMTKKYSATKPEII